MASREDRQTTAASRQADPEIKLGGSADDQMPIAVVEPVVESSSGDTVSTDNADPGKPADNRGAQTWFNPVFFLAVAALAMAVIYFDAWIGPDTRFIPREYAKEEPDRQELIATKVEFRLRRAEMFFHNEQKIYQARLNLARLLYFRGKYDRALRLVEIANESIPTASPVNAAFWIQAREYEEKGRYQDAAALLKMWKRKMPAGYDVAFDLVPFYEYSARIYKQLGDQDAYARAVDLAEQSRYVPRDWWEPLTPRSTSTAITEPPSLEYKQAINAMINDNLPESERLLKKIVGDSKSGFQNRLRSEVMLPVVLSMQDKFDESNDYFARAYRSLGLLDRQDPFTRSSQAVLMHAKIRAARAVHDQRLVDSHVSSEFSSRINFEHLAESDDPPIWRSLRDTDGKGTQ